MRYIFVLGRHTALSLIEIKATLREGGVVGEPGGRFVMVATDTPPLLPKLGGTDRIVEVLAEQDHQFSPEEILPLLPRSAEKKTTFGISGLPANKAKALGSGLKKLLRAEQKSVRFVIPRGKAPLLNAAQVLFNSLLTSQNVELVFVELGGRYYVGRTVQIQDIQAYEQRDTARPVRDAKVGMLPPKLAQIMLNIATGSATGLSVYDPFCGTGVVLQEGWLMRHHMVGSDSNPKMVAAAEQNLAYLAAVSPILRQAHGTPIVFKHDVQQEFPKDLYRKVDAIVTEPYLGRPLSTPLSPTHVEQAHKELGQLYRAFFKNALTILKPGAKLLFLLPVFKQTGGGWAFFAEAFLDELAQLGYGRKQLVPRREEAVYSRPEAIIGRELTLWQKL